MSINYVPITDLAHLDNVSDETIIPVGDSGSVYAIKVSDLKLYCEANAEGLETLSNYLKAAISGPLAANSGDDMTNQEKVYVYTGTTTADYTNGHWYYYDETSNPPAWADGGVYNAAAINTDTSLSVTGMAADSKAVGDTFARLNSHIADFTEPGINIIDQRRFLENTDWAYDSEQDAYYGALNKLSSSATIFRGLSYNYKASTQYTISFKAKISVSAGTGNGLKVVVKYNGESQINGPILKRNQTTWTTVSYTSTSGQTLDYFSIAYSGGATDIWYIKDLVVREGVSSTYVPYAMSAIDITARDQIADSMPLQPTRDTTDRAVEILNRLKTYGHCELGAGDFYISSLDMPPDSKLSGVGNATRLIKLGADIDANALYLTSDLESISGVSYTPIGYVGTAAQFGTAHLTPRSAYVAATAYKIHVRAQRVGGTPVSEKGLNLRVKYVSDESATYISGTTWMRDGTLGELTYITDSEKTVEYISFSYNNGGTDTWRISECTIAPEDYADGTGTAGYAIKMGHKCVLSDFALLGAEAEITPVATAVATPPANAGRDGIMLQGLNTDSVNDPGKRYYSLRNLFIANFSDSGLKAYGTGYATTSGAVITDVTVRKCGTGFQFNEYAEYNNGTGLRAHFCCVGIMVTGGNNFFASCNFGNNQTNLLMDNTSGGMNNNSHGGFAACAFNHSRGADWESDGGYACRIIKMGSGEVFTDCSFLGGGRIEIVNSFGIVFNGCILWNMKEVYPDVYFTCEGTGTGVTCSVLFIGCKVRNLERLKYRKIGTPSVFFRSVLDSFRGILIDEPPTPISE